MPLDANIDLGFRIAFNANQIARNITKYLTYRHKANLLLKSSQNSVANKLILDKE